jgi:hypothetical protein
VRLTHRRTGVGAPSSNSETTRSRPRPSWPLARSRPLGLRPKHDTGAACRSWLCPPVALWNAARLRVQTQPRPDTDELHALTDKHVVADVREPFSIGEPGDVG